MGFTLSVLSLQSSLKGSKVLIYGVGKSGLSALNEIANNPRLGLAPIGFIDDDPKNHGKSINGYPVLGTMDSLEVILQKHPASELILSLEDISLVNLERLSDICKTLRVPLRRFQTRLVEITPDSPHPDPKTEG